MIRAKTLRKNSRRPAADLEVRRSQPRPPQQDRGRARCEAILDIADEMLEHDEIENIGYYEIIKRAGMAPASAYHFFPSKAAVFRALAERYSEHFLTKVLKPPKEHFPQWQDVIAIGHQKAAGYYNSHKAAMKLLLGVQPFLEVQQADTRITKSTSNQTLHLFQTAYELPFILNVDRKFLVAIAISDGIWRASFGEFGKITHEYRDEGIRATIAYFRTFLPERLALRRSV